MDEGSVKILTVVATVLGGTVKILTLVPTDISTSGTLNMAMPLKVEGVPASIFMAAIWWLKSCELKHYPLTVLVFGLWFLLFAIGCIKKLFK